MGDSLMVFVNGIDYGDLIFSKRHELDKLAYSIYYNSCFDEIVDVDDIGDVIMITPPLSFNNWYGSEFHKKYIAILLRKKKLEKINKNENRG